MSYLLDTHAFLWWLFDDPKLSQTVRGLLTDPTQVVFVSSASAWEISTKYRLGKLDSAASLVQDIAGYVEQAGFNELAVSIGHAQRAGMWPQAHRDPFDRMLAAQAAVEGLSLITCDQELRQFGIDVIW